MDASMIMALAVSSPSTGDFLKSQLLLSSLAMHANIRCERYFSFPCPGKLSSKL